MTARNLNLSPSDRHIRSRERVAEHGEVFTPPWMVEAMIDLVGDEAERIDSRVLEPACGSGNFLVRVLQRKLAAVESKYGKSSFARTQYGLLSLMCIYGIELLTDNIAECRANLLKVVSAYLGASEGDELHGAASHVLAQNIVHGDALAMLAHDGGPIIFAEWGYLGRGKFQRRDFRLDVLAQSSGFNAAESTLWGGSQHALFTPVRTYSPMTTRQLADALCPEAGEPTR